MANYYVSRNQNKTWDAKREKAERASGVYETQREAELAAKQFSSNSGGGEVRIHGLDGKIRDSDTVPPGNDPFPPKG
jgi:predicted nucleotidyltransferase